MLLPGFWGQTTEVKAAYSHAFAVTMGIVAAVIGIMGLAVMWLLRRRTPAQSVPSA